VWQRVRKALAGKLNAIERLLAIVTVFQSITDDPPSLHSCQLLRLLASLFHLSTIFCCAGRTGMIQFPRGFRQVTKSKDYERPK
jgi:hypothetical protein